MSEFQCWDDFDVAVKYAIFIYLWGIKGTGKTTAAREALLGNNGQKVWATTVTEDHSVQELLGHWVPGEQWHMHHGPVVEAFKRGEGLAIDELGRSNGPVQDMFLGVLDDPKIATLTLPDSSIFTYKNGFRSIATSNSPPTEVGEALRDRFDTIINITVPHPKIIQKLNQALHELGDFILDSYKDPEHAISPRRAFAFMKFKQRDVELEQAARLAFYDRPLDVLEMLIQRGIV